MNIQNTGRKIAKISLYLFVVILVIYYIALLNSLKFTAQFFQNIYYVRVVDFWVALFTGDKAPKSLLESIQEAQNTHFFFIAGQKRQLEPQYNDLFHNATKNRSQIWVADVGHTEAFGRYPAEYKQRVLEFFDANLAPNPINN